MIDEKLFNEWVDKNFYKSNGMFPVYYSRATKKEYSLEEVKGMYQYELS